MDIQLQNAAGGVEQRLGHLRNRVKTWLIAHALVHVLAWTLGLFVADYAIDRFFIMDRPQRLVMLLIMLGLQLRVVYKRLWRPLRVTLSDEALCLEVERQNKDLSERLISLFQFTRKGYAPAAGISHELVNATVKDGLTEVEQVDFEAVLNRPGHKKNLGISAALILVFAGLGITCLSSPLLKTWVKRNLLIADVSWPMDYHLTIAGVEKGRLTIPRGDHWPVIAHIEDGFRRLPKRLQLEVKSRSGTTLEAMDRSDDGRLYKTVMQNVQEEYTFRVRGDQASTPWVKVRLVERPAVSEITLTAHPPAYAGQEAMALPPGRGPYYLLPGTGLEITGIANKTVIGAGLVIGDERVPMVLEDGSRFHLALEPGQVIPAVYRIELLDAVLVLNPESMERMPLTSADHTHFSVRKRDDTLPRVKVRVEGISSLVVPTARIPYRGTIEDDFKVTDVVLDYSWRFDDPDTGTSTNRAGQVEPSGVVDLLDQSRVDFGDVLDLATLQLPVGSSFGFVLQARDNNVVSGPGEGRSARIQLRVVAESDLRDDLLRREKEIRQALEQLLKRQDQLITDAQALQVMIRDMEHLDEPARIQANQVQKKQKLMGSGLSPLAKRLDSIVQEILNNGLETLDSPLLQRLKSRVANPMNRLIDQGIPSVANRLDELRITDDRDTRNQLLLGAIRSQEAITDEMRRILKYLVKNEEFQQAINLLSEIQQSQRDVREMTEEEKRRRVEALLEKQEK
jgi:hypothetical protein